MAEKIAHVDNIHDETDEVSFFDLTKTVSSCLIR